MTKSWTLSVTICLATALSACEYTTQEVTEKARHSGSSSEPAQQSPTNINIADESNVSPRLATAYNEVVLAYQDAGLVAPTRAELDDVSIQICENIDDGGDGLFHHPSLVDDSADELFAQALNYAFATATTCLPKGNFVLGQSMNNALNDALEGSPFDYLGVLEDSEKELEDSLISMNPNGTYDIDYSQLYLPGYGGNGGTSGGYPVTCSDGSISNSGGKQGACSWHNGLN